MEILKREVDKFYTDGKEFDTEEQATEYIDMKIRATDLRRIIEPYIKNNYVDRNDFYEDMVIALSDKKEAVIDVIERPF